MGRFIKDNLVSETSQSDLYAWAIEVDKTRSGRVGVLGGALEYVVENRDTRFLIVGFDLKR